MTIKRYILLAQYCTRTWRTDQNMPSDKMVFQACRAWKSSTFFVLEPITWTSFFFLFLDEISVQRQMYQTDKTKTKTGPDILWGCTANNNVTGWFLKMCFQNVCPEIYGWVTLGWTLFSTAVFPQQCWPKPDKSYRTQPQREDVDAMNHRGGKTQTSRHHCWKMNESHKRKNAKTVRT